MTTVAQQTPATITTEEITHESSKVTQEVNLDTENMNLVVRSIVTEYEVVKKLNPKTKKMKLQGKRQISFHTVTDLISLVPITVPEIKKLRQTSQPTFILKRYGKYFYSEVPADMNFLTSKIVGSHKCALFNKECTHLSPASDADGGCAKVREKSTGIEKYPWILEGYEAFNMEHDVFSVVTCDHYERSPKRHYRKLTPLESRVAQTALAQYLWDGISLEDVRKKITHAEESNEKFGYNTMKY